MRRKRGYASLPDQQIIPPAGSTSPRVDVLGVKVSAVDMGGAVAAIFGWIDRREPNYVCVTGVHGVMESYRAPDLRQIHNGAGMVTADGMPLAWLVRFAGHRASDRVCGPELMPKLFIDSQARGDRHFLYGGSQKALDLLQKRLLEIAPAANIVGACSPPYRALTDAEDEVIVAQINASEADIVWVGLSTPKQERWMAAHRDRLHAPVLDWCGRRVRHPCRPGAASPELPASHRTGVDLPAHARAEAALVALSVQQSAVPDPGRAAKGRAV